RVAGVVTAGDRQRVEQQRTVVVDDERSVGGGAGADLPDGRRRVGDCTRRRSARRNRDRADFGAAVVDQVERDVAAGLVMIDLAVRSVVDRREGRANRVDYTVEAGAVGRRGYGDVANRQRVCGRVNAGVRAVGKERAGRRAAVRRGEGRCRENRRYTQSGNRSASEKRNTPVRGLHECIPCSYAAAADFWLRLERPILVAAWSARNAARPQGETFL